MEYAARTHPNIVVDPFASRPTQDDALDPGERNNALPTPPPPPPQNPWWIEQIHECVRVKGVPSVPIKDSPLDDPPRPPKHGQASDETCR